MQEREGSMRAFKNEQKERCEIMRKQACETRAELQEVQSQNDQLKMCDEESTNDDAKSSCDQYLHEGGWQNADHPLHQQEFVQNEMQFSFRSRTFRAQAMYNLYRGLANKTKLVIGVKETRNRQKI